MADINHINPAFLSSLTADCGVYQMIDDQNTIIYIGKARNLKKRVSSYFQKKDHLNARIANLVKKITQIQVIITANESEALLLENQLIKKYQPKYNILLRDDKSYPWLVLSSHAYPRLSYFRHRKKMSDDYFGPYPDSHAVYKTIKLIQAIFKLRTCKDSFFNHRSRPCLLYQLKKCSAPCTGMITPEDYGHHVNNARLLLQGKNALVIKQLVSKMQKASAEQSYELAGQLRDQIVALRHIQTEQMVKSHAQYNLDAIVIMTKQQKTVIGLLSVRQGNITGNQIFYPDSIADSDPAEILSAFISQYYIHVKAKINIILKQACEDKIFLKKALGVKGINIILVHQQVDYIKYLNMAEKTATQALDSLLATQNTQQAVLQQLQVILQLAHPVLIIMCIDISHTAGESTVGACVVFDQKNGFCKKYYRRFNINNISAGDDYGAMSQVITRYFQRKNILPDLLLIDGGKGQLAVVNKALQAFSNHNIHILGIAKGPARKSGEEKFFLASNHHQSVINICLSPETAVFHLLQKIRDEAHRLAISTHRQQRAKTRKTSLLETIPGIGPKKRQALLSYLGGLQAIKKASIAQLTVVPGIDQKLAEKIYQLFQQ